MESRCGTADGVFDAVEDINDAMNFLYRLSDSGSGVRQDLGILAKELDDDGLGLAGQVANHVLQNLDELDFGGGLAVLNLRTNVVHDLIDVALTISLEFYGEITAIGFGDG